jgi:opacity protein-like surface antigen
LKLRFRGKLVAVKSAIIIVARVAFVGTAVQAADLPEAPTSTPIPVPTSNWTGPYIGLDAGMRYDAVDANVTSGRNTVHQYRTSVRDSR